MGVLIRKSKQCTPLKVALSRHMRFPSRALFSMQIDKAKMEADAKTTSEPVSR